MTKTMKPREMYSALKAGTVTEALIEGTWHRIPAGTDGMFLIGSRNWTITNVDGLKVFRGSGNVSFEVR